MRLQLHVLIVVSRSTSTQQALEQTVAAANQRSRRRKEARTRDRGLRRQGAARGQIRSQRTPQTNLLRVLPVRMRFLTWTRTSSNNFPRFQRFHGFNLQPMKPRAVSKVGLKFQLRLRLQVSRKRPSCHLQQLQRFHRKLETLRRFHWFHWPFATVSKVSPTI